MVASPERFDTTALAPRWIKPQEVLFDSTLYTGLRSPVLLPLEKSPVVRADLNRVSDGIDSFRNEGSDMATQ